MDGEDRERQERRREDQEAAHRRRPLLDDVAGRALLADLLAHSGAPQPLDERRADHDGEHHRDEACDQDTDHAPARFSIDAGMPSSPTARDAFTRIASPGLEQPGDAVEGVDVRNPLRPGESCACRYGSASSPIAITSSIPSSSSERPDLVVVAPRVGAELGHLAEDRDPASVARPLDEVEQRGAHRGRVGVVGVVDDDAAAGQRQLLPAPAAEPDRGRRPPAPARAGARAPRRRRAPRGCSPPCAGR